MDNFEIRCSKCGSNQVTADKKGFSGKKAVVGAALTGGIGLLAGTIGSNKIKITCLSCGHEFKPGEDAAGMEKKKKQQDEMVKSPVFWILFVVLLFFFLRACS